MSRWERLGLGAACVLMLLIMMRPDGEQTADLSVGRREVVFWHFWGGKDREVVEAVVRRFNESQNEHFVRAIAMPGNNLDLKLFLAVTGGDPPDVVNQDDPIIADWAHRGALTPLSELADEGELQQLKDWLFPAARRLGEYRNELYGLCNGLDVRALYCNLTLLQEHGLTPPRNLAELDRIAETIAPPGRQRRARFGYLPDSRRLWAWGVVFGGRFYDPRAQRPTIDSPPIAAALDWMAGYRERYGSKQISAFRNGDQKLPGSAFPLLPTSDKSPHGRYAVIMDGQWRVRDVAEVLADRRRRKLPVAEYNVVPLPPPPGGAKDAGWVNGNFFVVPRGARNPQGAWRFMKFWSGFDGHEAEAAATCARGGWIPVARAVAERAEFQEFLDRQPLFREFVRLAGSDQQIPIPIIPGAPLFNREVKQVGGAAMSDDKADTEKLLREVNRRVDLRLKEARHAR